MIKNLYFLQFKEKIIKELENEFLKETNDEDPKTDLKFLEKSIKKKKEIIQIEANKLLEALKNSKEKQ